MRIQYASDLHIELWPKSTYDETLQVTAPILVLCGDICIPSHPNYYKFLEYISEHWETILYVPGLSEMKESYSSFIKICSTFKNIFVLNMNHYLLKDDNDSILVIGLPLMARKHNEMFDENRSYLEKMIKTSPYPLLVLTYYPPFTWLYDEDIVKNPSETIAEPDLEKLITKPVIAWIVGHNHLPIEYVRRYFLSTGEEGSVLFVSNPRGRVITHKSKLYPQNIYYRKEAVLKLNPSMMEEYSSHNSSEIPEWHRKNLEMVRKQ